MVRGVTAALLVFIGALALGGDVRAQEKPVIEVGKAFPEIVLPVLGTGEDASVQRFRTRKVMLQVFASW